MSSSDAQPPLSRRQARERERAAAAGSQPVTPPPTVAAPDEPTDERRRPGSHVAPAPGGPTQTSAPASVPSVPVSSVPAAGVSPFPPASATEIVPGSGGLTRRQIRQQRAAQDGAVLPVPLQNPTPQSSDRTVADVLGSVDAIEPASAPRAGDDDRPRAEIPTVLDDAAVAQATEADGSPDALEPLDEAAAHAEEPRRHRSTWSPPAEGESAEGESAEGESAEGESADVDQADDDETSVDHADPAAAPTEVVDVQAPVVAPLPVVADPAASTPAVFPLSLDPEDDPEDDDTNEVTIPEPASAAAPTVPAAFQRPSEPKPLTTTFEPPVGHWSQQAHDSNDAEVHDDSTGTRRIAVTDTNAIILPNSALADPTGALNATGEVILTGSIDLPASLSSTGSHRPIDGAEVDRLLEQQDEQPETDASPVRASRAVSSHTSTRQVVLAAAKPKESRTPLILGVTVGAVGLAAAGVIITALLTTHMGG
ncbi:hypothetical protein [Curtobacterium sp. VKM Ac-1393]|uniref:hypothetical protein n=1 Tax=Curtobacterium sp. VKM Ac-1393 TaxID=2783814 RepID=UPI00188C07DF|nr:hypothetical protein [Curtobacterium sp. VKM Ac-1393]MBF4607191.1 hypothetical protein [Curtobacterium sp. VKM Ac-1393]